MFVLPLNYFEIYTNIKPDMVFQRLCSVVETQKHWKIFYTRSDKPYYGDVEENKFNITRKIWYRNSALPVILGEVHPDGKGSRINITMRLSWCTMGFMIFWLGMITLMFINFSSDWVISVLHNTVEEAAYWGFLIPVGFFAFGYFLVTLIPYKIEAGIASTFLLDLFGKGDVIIHKKFLGLNDFQISLVFFLFVIMLVLLKVLYNLFVGVLS